MAAFLLIDLATIEPYSGLQVVLQATLLLLFGLVLYTLVGLPVLWMAFREITDSVLGLPLGQTFDRLPRRLTSRFASFGEAMSGSLDAELKGRFAQLRGACALGCQPAISGPRTCPTRFVPTA